MRGCVAMAAAAALVGCGGSSHHRSSSNEENPQDPGITEFDFAVSGTVANASAQCDPGVVANGDVIAFDLAGDHVRLVQDAVGCLGEFTGTGDVSDDTTGVNFPISFTVSTTLGFDDCTDFTDRELADYDNEIIVVNLVEDATDEIPFECNGLRSGGDITSGDPLQFNFYCPNQNSGCTFTMQGTLAAEFDFVTVLNDAEVEASE
ncbi:MAG: hypothetical protein KC466_15075 [Myxococcales bacterium]|nr:hypothetical protein [Myxococcales bacterium]